MDHPLSILALVLTAITLGSILLFRKRIGTISFLHIRWVGIGFSLSFVGFFVFLLSEVVELVLPIEALENSLITVSLGVFTVRALTILALLMKQGGRAGS